MGRRRLHFDRRGPREVRVGASCGWISQGVVAGAAFHSPTHDCWAGDTLWHWVVCHDRHVGPSLRLSWRRLGGRDDGLRRRSRLARGDRAGDESERRATLPCAADTTDLRFDGGGGGGYFASR